MEHPEPIVVRNARTHNLKEVSMAIPRNRLVVFTGVSGNGKSSLVFDTLYTEAQRQLIETFGTFARRRLPKLSRPDVDGIENLSTAIIIDQKRMGRTLRSRRWAPPPRSPPTCGCCSPASGSPFSARRTGSPSITRKACARPAGDWANGSASTATGCWTPA